MNATGNLSTVSINKGAGLSINNSNNVAQSPLSKPSTGNMNRLIPGVPALGGMPPLSQSQALSHAVKQQTLLSSSVPQIQQSPSLPLGHQQTGVSPQAPTALMTVQPSAPSSLPLQPTSSLAQPLQSSLSTLSSEQTSQSTSVSNTAPLTSIINKPPSSSGISPALEQAFMQYLQVFSQL